MGHLDTLLELPHHHGDPFDRLIISQAISENLTIISADRHFKAYPVSVLW
ncbi:PIN domain-containing protein [Mucilaginibacter sp. UC70_90]